MSQTTYDDFATVARLEAEHGGELSELSDATLADRARRMLAAHADDVAWLTDAEFATLQRLAR